MNKSQIKKQKYILERKLKRRTFLSIIIHIIILILFCIYTKEVNESYNYETIKPYNHMDYHIEGMYDINTYTDYEIENNKYSKFIYSKDWDIDDDYFDGALYFESCKNKDNWYSRNLEFIYESDGMRFYK